MVYLNNNLLLLKIILFYIEYCFILLKCYEKGLILIKPVKIISKKYVHHTGKVYDLEVEDIHSYNIDGLVVHNSGGGSVVNNLLGVTKIDPIKHGLIFERFLNQDRGHLPKHILGI